jgi:hypothetical protein
LAYGALNLQGIQQENIHKKTGLLATTVPQFLISTAAGKNCIF